MEKLRVLLVDVDPQRRDRISSMLAAADHNVFPVSSVQEAEETLHVVKVDVVLLGSPDLAPQPFVHTLRRVEKEQKRGGRATVLALSPEVPVSAEGCSTGSDVIDGYLPEQFDPQTLVNVYQTVGQATTAHGNTAESAPQTFLQVFDVEKFRQQVAYDQALAAEIIELFLEERRVELPQMWRALAEGDFRQLSELAHTMKGSLSSLHAMVARHRAQELEAVAKAQDNAACGRILSLLVSDLEALEPLLVNLRDHIEPS